jgi:S1-C subfamily serine protease
MNVWKTGAVTAALLVSAGAGAAFMPAAQAQDRSREPVARALQLLGGGGSQIGVTVHDVDAKDANASGVIVDEVSDNSPAAKAGLKRDDRIVEFDGERVRSVAQFRRLVQETPPDRTVPIAVQRGTERVTAPITPETRPGALSLGDFPMTVVRPAVPAVPRAPMPPALPRRFDFGDRDDMLLFQSSDGRFGASVENLNDQLRDYFGVKGGVLVRMVRSDSPAAKAGLKAGDVITAVNGRAVDAPSDLADALRKAGDGGEISVEISRDRKTQTLKAKLEPRSERSRSRAVVTF